MSESQSRYSIVERLTAQKLSVMSSKLALKDEIAQIEQQIEMMSSTLEEEKKKISNEAKQSKKTLDNELKAKKMELKHKKDRFEEQNLLFEEKIKDINSALDRIENISKLSQEESLSSKNP